MAILASFDELHEILGTGSVLLALLVAGVVGRKPWRLAAAVLALELIGSLALAVLDRYDRVLFTHGKSILVAGLLALIVLRHRAPGLIVLLALQFFALLLHLAVWLEPTILARANALTLNGVGWAMILTLAAGSLQSRVADQNVRYHEWRRRPGPGHEDARGG